MQNTRDETKDDTIGNSLHIINQYRLEQARAQVNKMASQMMLATLSVGMLVTVWSQKDLLIAGIAVRGHRLTVEEELGGRKEGAVQWKWDHRVMTGVRLGHMIMSQTMVGMGRVMDTMNHMVALIQGQTDTTGVPRNYNYLWTLLTIIIMFCLSLYYFFVHYWW